MIIINSIEEIEKYKIGTKKPTSKNSAYDKIAWYAFKENGKLADVVFNVRVPYSFFELCEKTYPYGQQQKKKYNCLFEETKHLKLEKLVGYAFRARNITFVDGGGLAILIADNFDFKSIANIEQIVVENKITGDKLSAEYVYAGDIDAEYLCVFEDLNCKYVKAKELSLGKYTFLNITSEMM